jgi:hypothetical protein
MSVRFISQIAPAARLLMKSESGTWWVYYTGRAGEDPNYAWDMRLFEYAGDGARPTGSIFTAGYMKVLTNGTGK